jgi:peroxiredoxin
MAINFTVTDAAGKSWTLSDHLDSAVVLTFQRGDF